MSGQSLLVCPQCYGPLAIGGTSAACESCKRTYACHPSGFLDLRVDDTSYEDWLSTGEESQRKWLKEYAPIEAVGAQHMVQRYLIPLLRRPGVGTRATVLSVGCGGGWDIETLRKHSFLAWGIDNGGRVGVWKDRFCVDYLILGDALHLPFPEDVFDFVFAEGVIEHIGYAGDSPYQRPDWQMQRQQFVESLLRVTRPGGYILVACPNRLFPIDFFHGGKPFFGLTIRFHSPFESFLLSFGDIKRLFAGQAKWIRPLTLKNFFNLRRLAGGKRLMTSVIVLMEFLLRLIPDAFFGTAFSPYLVIFVQKRNHPS